MRILHTSDLHLSTDKPYTLEALHCLLDTCRTHSVDLLTIGGGTFNKPEDVEQLRKDLRKVFSGLGFDVISISGNHDETAYTRNLDFNELKMVTLPPFEIHRYEDANIVALPYTEEMTDDLYTQIKKAVEKNKYNVLLMHCTLDISYSPSDFGDEDVRKYCPVSSSVLASLGYDVILGGHFHTDYYIKEIGVGSRFVYPGSPVSLTTREIGERRVALIDTETKTITSIPLATHFFDKKSVSIVSGNEQSSLDSITEWIKEFEGKNCTLSVEVDGFGEMDETEFSDELKTICEGMYVTNGYLDVSNVLEHSLYKRFEKQIDEKEDIDIKYTKKVVIEVFSEMLARRVIE